MQDNNLPVTFQTVGLERLIAYQTRYQKPAISAVTLSTVVDRGRAVYNSSDKMWNELHIIISEIKEREDYFMKNINHVTFNTGKNVQYKDDSVMTKEVQGLFQEMAVQAIIKREIEIADGIKLKCEINPEEKTYIATIFLDDIPLVKTAGAFNQDGAEHLWPIMENSFEEIFGMKTPAVCPKTPFICDIVYCPVIFKNVTAWCREVTKCFGIEMLKMLLCCKERK